MLEPANRDAFADYLWGRELIDLFVEFPQQGINPDDFVGLLRPMPPGAYTRLHPVSKLIPSRFILPWQSCVMILTIVRGKEYALRIWLTGWERPYLATFTRIKTSNYHKILMLQS